VLLAAVAIAGLLADAGSAMAPWIFIKVTPQGPDPRVVRAVVGYTPVAWYGDATRGRRVIFAGGACRGSRVAAPTGMRLGCYFKKPGRYVYRIQGLPNPGVMIVRAARPGERYCGGPCPTK
jgi:hypothetical protein